MSPTATVLSFGTPTAIVKPKIIEATKQEWIIVGNIQSCEFQKAIDLAKQMRQKSRLFEYKIIEKTETEFAEWKVMKQKENDLIIPNLFSNVMIESQGKFYQPKSFFEIAEKDYDVTGLDQKTYADKGNQAFLSFLYERKIYNDICPKLAQLFLDCVIGKSTVADGAPQEAMPWYKGATCTRLILKGWAQFEPKKNLTLGFHPVNHDSRGIVSLVNQGPNTNSCQFMILLNPMPHFDKKYVAIGKVVSGLETLEMIERVTTRFEKPDFEISISESKEL